MGRFYRQLPDFHGFYRVKACFFHLSQAFTVRVNTLKSNPSHSKPLKINRKRVLCEGVNTFFGLLKPYRRAREKSIRLGAAVKFVQQAVYIRARKEHFQNRLRLFQPDKSASPAQADTAWSSLHKSPTCPHNSLIRQNKSRAFGNNSRTFGKCLSYPQSLILHNLSRIRNFSNLY